MLSRSRHFLPPAAAPLAAFALASCIFLPPVALRAAEPLSVEDRLRQLESRLTTLERENAALRRELGHPPSSAPSAPLPPSSLFPVSAAPSLPPSSPPALRLTGDIRTRFSSVMYEAPEAATRDQLLFQVHAGFVASVSETLEGGLRLTAGDLNPNFGGSPLSAQFAAADNASRKHAFIDQLFIRWKPALASGATATFTFGKSANPFYTPSRLLFDNDYNPEGATEEFSFPLSPHHRLSFAAGQYLLDDLTPSARDPWMFAARTRWEAQWRPAWSTTLGAAWLGLTHAAALTATNLPNNNRGNTRTAAGVLVHDYRPFFAEASVTHLLDRAPAYAGKFPVTLHAEFLRNPGAPADRDAWTAGLAFGRAGKAGQWELGYRYLRIAGDAWFEEMLDGEYGGYYRSVPPGWNTDAASLTGGAGGGTNTRSHVFRTSYSPRDYLLFSANLFLNDLLRSYPARAPDTGAKRLQFETLLRF